MKKYKMEFDNLYKALKGFCAANCFACTGRECPFSMLNIGVNCTDFVHENPDKAAELMGLEVIEVGNKPRLTEQELAICKALGAKWVSRDDVDPSFSLMDVRFWKSMPSKGSCYCYTTKSDSDAIAVCDADLFPSLSPGDLVNVDELLKEAAP